jgi:ECF transporter S component (folate family)
VGGLPIIASGFLCGPVFGSLTGAAADILGMLIFPHGPYFPVFTLTSGLTGFFPGFFRYFLDRKRMFIKLFFIIFFTQFFTTVFGVSFFLSRITGIDFEFLFYPRLIVLFIEAPFFSFFLGRLFLIRPDFICFNGKQTKNLSYRSCFADNL